MSVILTAPNSKIAMAAPGRPMLAAPLASTVPGGGGAGGGGTASLASVAGLTGWWDAGVVSNVLGPTGTPLSTSVFVAGSGFTLGTTDYHDGCASEWEVDTGTGSITPTMTLGGAPPTSSTCWRSRRHRRGRPRAGGTPTE